jgi:hypothetical protein
VFVWSDPCRPEGTRPGDADDDAPDISELELEDPDDEVMTRRQLPATRHLTVAVSRQRLCHSAAMSGGCILAGPSGLENFI